MERKAVNFDRPIFFNAIRPLFGGRLNQPQVDGMDAILNAWEKRSPNGDPRWLAYMFATAFHETAYTMQPVREAYWLSEAWRKQNLKYYPYYGRGYVQLTHKENYQYAGQFIGADLVRYPDLALDAGNASVIMFVGMEQGWFRGDAKGRHTLSRYFSRQVDDPRGAREIINGKEVKTINGKKVVVADIIAGYHQSFFRAIMAGAGRRMGMQSLFSAKMPGFGDFGEGRPELSVAGKTSLAAIEEAEPFATTDDDAFGDAGDVGQDMEPEAQDAALSGYDHASDPYALLDRTVELVGSYVGKNKVPEERLPDFIASVHSVLATLLAPSPAGLGGEERPLIKDVIGEGESEGASDRTPAL